MSGASTDIVRLFETCKPINVKPSSACSMPVAVVNGFGFPGGLLGRYRTVDILAPELAALEEKRILLAEAATAAERDASFHCAADLCTVAFEYASALRDFSTKTPRQAYAATPLVQNIWRVSMFTRMRFPHDARGVAGGKVRLQPPGKVPESERMVATRTLSEEERFAWFTTAEVAHTILWAAITQWSTVSDCGDIRESLLLIASLGDEATRVILDSRLWPPFPKTPRSTRFGEFHIATAVMYFLTIRAATTVLVTTAGGRHEQLSLSEKEFFRRDLTRAVAVVENTSGGALSFAPAGFFLRTVMNAVSASVFYDAALMCLNVANNERAEGHASNPRNYIFISAAALCACRIRMTWAMLTPPNFYLESMLVNLLRLGVVPEAIDQLGATIELRYRTARQEGKPRGAAAAASAKNERRGPSEVSDKILLPHVAFCEKLALVVIQRHIETPLARFPEYVLRQP